MSRRVAAAIALVVILISLGAGAYAWRARPVSGEQPRVGAAGGPLRSERIGALSPAFGIAPAERALARAVSAAGRAADGDARDVTSLDDDAKEALAAARRMLAVGERAHHARIAGPSEGATDGGALREGGSANRADAGSAPGGRIDVASAPDPRQALLQTPDGPQLRLPGLWAKTLLTPTVGKGTWTIRNESGAAYVIAVEAGDFSAIRVDGGMIVPGRFYRVGAQTTIGSDAPCTIVIRPLDAVPSYYDAPMLPGSANG